MFAHDGDTMPLKTDRARVRQVSHRRRAGTTPRRLRQRTGLLPQPEAGSGEKAMRKLYSQGKYKNGLQRCRATLGRTLLACRFAGK